MVKMKILGQASTSLLWEKDMDTQWALKLMLAALMDLNIKITQDQANISKITTQKQSATPLASKQDQF